MTTTQYIDEDTKIPLPLVGKFYFRKRAGRKAGTVYKMPICTKNEIRTIELTEDEPDIYEIKFKPSVMLSRKVKAYFRKGVDNATSI